MKRRKKDEQIPKTEIEDCQRIEEIVELIYQDIMKKGGRFKVSELIKSIELKRKLAPPDDRDKQFWDMIDDLRAEKLSPTVQSQPGKTPKQSVESGGVE